jgi:acetyl-CoA carboxylase carboxyltransferase component
VGTNVVTGLGRLGGGTVGVIADNPIREGGCLGSPAAGKAARFLRTCDSFGAPDWSTSTGRRAGEVERGVIDEVVRPADTRWRLVRAFAEVIARFAGERGDYEDIPL